MAAKIQGQRGSWFATAGGELLPCVHSHWFKNGWYADPGVRPGEAQWDGFIAAIKTGKKVILTTDNVSEDDKAFERTGYVAIFRVDDVVVSDGVLKFKFVERLEDAKQ
jgi:hypothetical protein